MPKRGIMAEKLQHCRKPPMANASLTVVSRLEKELERILLCKTVALRQNCHQQPMERVGRHFGTQVCKNCERTETTEHGTVKMQRQLENVENPVNLLDYVVAVLQISVVTVDDSIERDVIVIKTLRYSYDRPTAVCGRQKPNLKAPKLIPRTKLLTNLFGRTQHCQLKITEVRSCFKLLPQPLRVARKPKRRFRLIQTQ